VETVACLLCGRSDARPVRVSPDRLASSRGASASTAGEDATTAGGRRTAGGGGTPASFTVVRCPGCGLAYVNPRPTPAEIGRYYPDDYHTARGAGGAMQRLENAWRQRQFGEVVGWLAALRPGRGRLLDVGCGAGEMLEALRPDGWTVSGVEPSARGADVARRQRGLDVQTAAFDDAVLAPGSYEVVVFAAALEHLHDPLAALTRARALLAPGGLLAVLFLPRFDAPQARLFGPDWMGLDLPRHLYHFEPRTFTATAQRAGLRVVATEPYSRRHSPAFWTASLFPGLQKQRLNLLARREPGRAAAGKAAFAALTAAARPLARAEAALGFEPQRSYFLVAASEPGAAPDLSAPSAGA
jgi:SAM-dependent methyltransferase